MHRPTLEPDLQDLTQLSGQTQYIKEPTKLTHSAKLCCNFQQAYTAVELDHLIGFLLIICNYLQIISLSRVRGGLAPLAHDKLRPWI